MSTLNSCDMIQHSSLTRDLTADQCTALAQLCQLRELADHELLFQEGDADQTLYIVGDGALAVERVTSGGDVITLHILRAGDLAGELGFIDGTEHSASLRAVGKTSVVCIERKDVEKLLQTRPEVVYGLMRGIIRTVHRILRRMNLQNIELSNYITKTHGRY